jgi:hypothetical protein
VKRRAEPPIGGRVKRGAGAMTLDMRRTLEELLVDASPSEEELAWSGVTFRLRLLDACGFGPDAALALAIRPEIGLEEPLALIRRGCAPDVAARILI